MKILVIRFSSIGDIVLTSAVVRCLAQQLDTEIHYLTKSQYAILLANDPNIEKVHSWSPEIHQNVVQALEQEKYDYIVDLHNNIRTQRIKLALGVPSSTFPKLNWQKWLRVNIKYDVLPDEHIVDRYFKAVQALGVENDQLGLDFHLPSTAFRPISRPYLAFAIGAAHATKRMTASQIQKLCSRIDHQIILLGGPDEKAIGDRLAATIPHVQSFCGSSSLMESAHLINQATLLLSHDTGMMHIGAALKKPIISVWGNTIPKFGMYPYYPRDFPVYNKMIEVSDLRCRPCSKIGYDTCPKGHFRCMNDQNIDAIGTLCNEFLSNRLKDSSDGKDFLS